MFFLSHNSLKKSLDKHININKILSAFIGFNFTRGHLISRRGGDWSKKHRITKAEESVFMSRQAGSRGRNQRNRSLDIVYISALPPREKSQAVNRILRKARAEGTTLGFVSIDFRSRKYGKVTVVAEFQRPNRLVCPKESAHNLYPKPQARKPASRDEVST